MDRSQPAVFVRCLPAFLALVGLTAACTSPPEQQIIQKYFQASRMRDNTTLANIATVSFSPTEQGVVQGFKIVSIGDEQRTPLRLKELAKAEAEARQADEAFNKKKKEYQDANLAAIERVLAAERANKPLRGPDLKVQEEWTKWREQTAEHAKAVTEARRALNAARSLAEVSVFDARDPVDVTQYDGELVTKDVTISARVRTPEGQVQEKQLYVRLTRAELTGGPEARPTVSGRWIVTHVDETPPGPVRTTSN